MQPLIQSSLPKMRPIMSTAGCFTHSSQFTGNFEAADKFLTFVSEAEPVGREFVEHLHEGGALLHCGMISKLVLVTLHVEAGLRQC